MRRALVRNHGLAAGVFEANETGYAFTYSETYDGEPISLTMPVRPEPYHFKNFPPFFDGLLPEGFQLGHLLCRQKLDEDDFFGQLMAVGGNTVGSVTVEEIPSVETTP